MKRNVKCPECGYARKTTKNILNDICPTCNIIMETVTTAEPLKSAPALVNPPTAEDIKTEAKRKSANYAPFPNYNQDPSYLAALREAYRQGFMACAYFMRTKAGDTSCDCGEPITQDSCPKCGAWHDLYKRR